MVKFVRTTYRITFFFDVVCRAISLGAVAAYFLWFQQLRCKFVLLNMIVCLCHMFAAYPEDMRAFGMHLASLDVEWRPHTWTSPGMPTASKSWPASLLQVALGRSVYLIDLLALYASRCSAPARTDDAMSSSLGWLLRE